ncbi:MAG: hypothetical protein V1866_02435 [archaeon]
MAKSGNSRDKIRSEIVFEEIEHFKKLTSGHMKLLEAIGNL